MHSLQAKRLKSGRPRWATPALIAVLCVLAAPPTVASADALPTPAAISAVQQAAIDAAVTETMSREQIPGVSLAILHDGAIVYEHGYGYRDVAAEAPVDPQTYFEIGSVTKQFTTAAIALLAQDGKLNLDDPVSKYVPDAPTRTRSRSGS
ncbi:MAG TPA: serine hydrolase domain-containing protein [Candidatus Acidoferrales bacterium]|nr:serine hydrolase domain-containing protein [Candidatus Acidoferrales bacterium]